MVVSEEKRRNLDMMKVNALNLWGCGRRSADRKLPTAQSETDGADQEISE